MACGTGKEKAVGMLLWWEALQWRAVIVVEEAQERRLKKAVPDEADTVMSQGGLIRRSSPARCLGRSSAVAQLGAGAREQLIADSG